MSGHFDVDFFDVLDRGEGRACHQIVFEGFDRFGRSFGQRFDTSVRKIAHVSQNLMARGGALREEAIAYALHFPANQKFSRDFHHLPLLERYNRHSTQKTRRRITQNSVQ